MGLDDDGRRGRRCGCEHRFGDAGRSSRGLLGRWHLDVLDGRLARLAGSKMRLHDWILAAKRRRRKIGINSATPRVASEW